jgi:F-type H+-transporting ATPase subunit c
MATENELRAGPEIALAKRQVFGAKESANAELKGVLMSKNKLMLASVALTTLTAAPAFAAEGAEAAGGGSGSAAAIGAAIAIGLAVLGGGLGQGRAAAAALEGISRNPGAAPRIQTPMILGLALIESLVLFAFIIAFILTGKI